MHEVQLDGVVQVEHGDIQPLPKHVKSGCKTNPVEQVKHRVPSQISHPDIAVGQLTHDPIYLGSYLELLIL